MAVGSRLDTWFDDQERAEAMAPNGSIGSRPSRRSRRIATTLLELAFGWILAHRPVASVIAGATSAEQVVTNAAAGGWILDAAELAAVPLDVDDDPFPPVSRQAVGDHAPSARHGANRRRPPASVPLRDVGA